MRHQTPGTEGRVRVPSTSAEPRLPAAKYHASTHEYQAPPTHRVQVASAKVRGRAGDLRGAVVLRSGRNVAPCIRRHPHHASHGTHQARHVHGSPHAPRPSAAPLRARAAHCRRRGPSSHPRLTTLHDLVAVAASEIGPVHTTPLATTCRRTVVFGLRRPTLMGSCCGSRLVPASTDGDGNSDSDGDGDVGCLGLARCGPTETAPGSTVRVHSRETQPQHRLAPSTQHTVHRAPCTVHSPPLGTGSPAGIVGVRHIIHRIIHPIHACNPSCPPSCSCAGHMSLRHRRQAGGRRVTGDRPPVLAPHSPTSAGT